MDTPISVLQDFCSRYLDNKGPDYQLLSSDSLIHKPTFTFRVEVDGIIITASGQSKKKAKHAAALEALASLIDKYPDENVSKYLKETSFATEDSTKIAGEGEEVNAVGKLQELCMKKKWRPPRYDPLEETTKEHDRSFKVICTIDTEGQSFNSTGYGRSKKLAKRSSAIEMLSYMERTGNLPRDFIAQSMPSKVPFDPSSIGPRQLAEESTPNVSVRHDSKLASDKVVEFFKSFDSELNQSLTGIIDESINSDPEATLEHISDYIECNVRLVNLSDHCLPEAGDSHIMAASLVPMDIYYCPIPIVTGLGEGSSEFIARAEACKKALQLFDRKRKYYCDTNFDF